MTMEPNPGIDFNFFSSASVPYNYYGLPPTPQAESPYVEGFKNFHGNVRLLITASDLV